MGYEYGIILKSGEYTKAVQELAQAFQSFSTQWINKSDEKGFSLLCPDDKKWPDRFQIIIQTADRNTGIAPEGKLYLYCLSYLNGDEEQRALDCIESVLHRLGYSYEIDDL